MTTERNRRRWTGILWVVALAAAGLGLYEVDWSSPARGGDPLGTLELDARSDYSHIRLRRTGNVRTLWFVRDNGEEVVESMLDLKRPHDLLVSYTRFMFLSYLFRPQQEHVLIVGLGGGSMVHFLARYDPKVKVDVVEIDPTIVALADKYFGVRSGGNVKVITKDAFAYLRTTDEKYDVIYMDAFLKPSRDTDETGSPLKLKTINFYKELQRKLTPDGLVVFNINPHSGIDEDVRTIKEAFPQTYVFDLPNYAGLVVVGSTNPKRIPAATLMTDAGQLERRFVTTYSYRDMVRRLEK